MNFIQLKAAIAEWAHRANISTATVETFIVLAEAEFNNRLRMSEQETTADLASTGRYTPLPADFLSMRGVSHASAPSLTPIQYESPEYIGMRASMGGGVPRAYSIRGMDIELLPAPDSGGSVTISYWAKIPALSDASLTNWLIDAHPNMYLFECLRQLSLYTKDDASAQRYANQMQSYFQALKRGDQDRRFGGAAMRVRAA